MNSQVFHDVSVIIPVTQDSSFIERCIRSCCAQTFPGRSYEVIILHDGKDSSVDDIITNYGRGQYIYSLVSELTPQSVIASALKKSTGRFMVFVNPSDFISDFMILTQTIFLYDNSSFGGVSVDYWMVEPQSDRKLNRISSKERPILEGMMFRKDILAKLSHSEGQSVLFDPPVLFELISRNSKIEFIPFSFYRKSIVSASNS
jgi:glycosyltransferase involved in cell wall biosynthesis